MLYLGQKQLWWQQLCEVVAFQQVTLGGNNGIVMSQQGQTSSWGFGIVQEKLFNLCIRFYS